MGGLLVRLHEATKPGTSTDSAKISPHTKNRRREPRTRPTTSYEARKSASTARASHDTTYPPQTPHAEAHTPACTSSATQTRLRTQKTAGTSPFEPAPAVRASRVPTQSQHKASEKLAKLARRQISRSALRRASRLPSRSRRSYGQTRSDRTERC